MELKLLHCKITISPLRKVITNNDSEEIQKLPSMFQTKKICLEIFSFLYTGCFVKLTTWFDLVEPAMNDCIHYGHLIVLSGLIEGSPTDCITDHVEDLSKLLGDDSICCTRKVSFDGKKPNSIVHIPVLYSC